jgi:hypothetical protein
MILDFFTMLAQITPSTILFSVISIIDCNNFALFSDDKYKYDPNATNIVRSCELRKFSISGVNEGK